MKKRIWHVSDSHTYHRLLVVPKNVDIVIFSGDCSNPRDPYTNEPEVRNFLTWFAALPIKHKIFVAGNHDTSIEKKLITKIDFVARNIIYLENDYCFVDDLKIFGTPYTPSFGMGWAFNKARNKMHDKIWSHVEDDTDIIISHGPPKYILDLSTDMSHNLEFCGCSSFFKLCKKLKPKLVCFGHIHDNDDICNSGIKQIAGLDTIFSNGSIVKDGEFGKLISNGNIIEI